MESFQAVPPFSNHAPLPVPLRVLVAQTPFIHENERGMQGLLAHLDLSESTKMPRVPTSQPIIFTMRPVAKFAAESKETPLNWSSPSIASPRSSPFPDESYMSFLPMPSNTQESQSPGQETAPPAMTLRSGKEDTASPIFPIAKPKSCGTMNEASLAKAWGQTPAKFSLLKVIMPQFLPFHPLRSIKATAADVAQAPEANLNTHVSLEHQNLDGIQGFLTQVNEPLSTLPAFSLAS